MLPQDAIITQIISLFGSEIPIATVTAGKGTSQKKHIEPLNNPRCYFWFLQFQHVFFPEIKEND